MPVALAALAVLALLAVALAVGRLLAGPTSADRVVAQDLLFSAALVLCVSAALYTRQTAFLDVALGLGLVGFVATIGWARLVHRAPRGPRGRRP